MPSKQQALAADTGPAKNSPRSWPGERETEREREEGEWDTKQQGRLDWLGRPGPNIVFVQ